MNEVAMEAQLLLAPPRVQRAIDALTNAVAGYELLTGKQVTTAQVVMSLLATLASIDAATSDAQWLVDAGWVPESFMTEWAEYQAL